MHSTVFWNFSVSLSTTGKAAGRSTVESNSISDFLDVLEVCVGFYMLVMANFLFLWFPLKAPELPSSVVTELCVRLKIKSSFSFCSCPWLLSNQIKMYTVKNNKKKKKKYFLFLLDTFWKKNTMENIVWGSSFCDISCSRCFFNGENA